MTEQKPEQSVTPDVEIQVEPVVEAPEEKVAEETVVEEAVIEEAIVEEAAAPIEAAEAEAQNRLFLVAGKNDEMKKSAQEIMAKLGFEAILLEAVEEGKSMVDQCAEYTGVSFAIVLLADDEVATLREQFPKNAVLQARAEEIFMLGFLSAKLGFKKVFPLYSEKQNFKKPLEYADIPYTVYDPQGRWQFDLARALKAAGYAIDANKLI